MSAQKYSLPKFFAPIFFVSLTAAMSSLDSIATGLSELQNLTETGSLVLAQQKAREVESLIGKASEQLAVAESSLNKVAEMGSLDVFLKRLDFSQHVSFLGIIIFLLGDIAQARHLIQDILLSGFQIICVGAIR